MKPTHQGKLAALDKFNADTIDAEVALDNAAWYLSRIGDQARAQQASDLMLSVSKLRNEVINLFDPKTKG